MNIERIVRLALLVLTILVIRRFIDDICFKTKLKNLFILLTFAQAITGFVDLGTKFLFSTPIIQNFTSFFFGVGVAQSRSFVMRANVISIQGFMKEPSHFATSFLPGVMVLLSLKEYTFFHWVVEFLSIIILILSTSFTGFVIVLFWFIFRMIKFLASSRSLTLIRIIGAIAVIFVVGSSLFALRPHVPIVDYYLQRLLAIVGIGESVGSESIRLLSIKSAFGYLMASPLFGIGIGSSIAHGFIPNMLSNIGLLGSLAWITFMFKSLRIRVNGLYNILFLMVLVLLMSFLGDIGWVYNMEGLSIFVALKISLDAFYQSSSYLSTPMMKNI